MRISSVESLDVGSIETQDSNGVGPFRKMFKRKKNKMMGNVRHIPHV